MMIGLMKFKLLTSQTALHDFPFWVNYTRTKWILNSWSHPPSSTCKARRCQLSQSSLAKQACMIY